MNAKIHNFHSDAEIQEEINRNRRITQEDVTKTFGRPIFVYGTLLRGLGNYNRLLKGRTDRIIEAKLYGHSISSGGGFPFMDKVPSGTPVLGELVYLPDNIYLDVLRRLDWLEGVEHGFYKRSKVRVVTAEGSKVAWAYTCSRYNPERHIKSGSWRQHIGDTRGGSYD